MTPHADLIAALDSLLTKAEKKDLFRSETYDFITTHGKALREALLERERKLADVQRAFRRIATGAAASPSVAPADPTTPETEDVHYACAELLTDVDRYIAMREHAQRLERERDALLRKAELYDELWKHCRIVFYSKNYPLDYPIEHAPHANKDSRWMIEAAIDAGRKP